MYRRGRSENLVELRDALARGGEPFAISLGNFLDQFYASPSAGALSAEPAPLAGAVENGDYYDAFLAATAEYLATEYGLAVPAWAGGRSRFLPEPRVTVRNPKLRDLLLSECPAPFKRRGVIVSRDALLRV